MNTSLISFFGDILFINRMSQGFLNAAPVCLPNYLGSAFTCFHPIFGEDVQFD